MDIKNNKLLDYNKTLLLLIDIWDKHWCTNWFNSNKDKILNINKFKDTVQNQGATIVHCPSSCLKYYNKYPQSIKNKKLKHYSIENISKIDFNKLLLEPDKTSCGCECIPSCQNKNRSVWSKINKNITINSNDYIIDDSPKDLYNIIRKHNIENIIYVGFALNLCIYRRNIGIKNTALWGINIYIVEDLTDIFYNIKTGKIKFKTHSEAKDYALNYYKSKGIKILKYL